jgi:ribokinase
MSARPRVIVVGSANVDLRLRLPALPAPGETLAGGEFSQTFGGKGANSAVGAAQAGADAVLIGCVGADVYGDLMFENLRRRKVGVDFLVRDADVPTGTAFILLDAAGQNMIGIAAGANAQVAPLRLDQLRGELKKASVIVVQNEIPPETVVHLLQMAQEERWRVLYNAAPARPLPGGLLPSVEWLVVNESEAASLSGLQVESACEAEAAARALRQAGAKNVLVTLGAAGVCAATSDGVLHFPAYPVTPIDTVAAGDIFCGTLALAFAEGHAMTGAIRFASAAAALSVTRPGAQDSAPDRQEIDAFLQLNEPVVLAPLRQET